MAKGHKLIQQPLISGTILIMYTLELIGCTTLHYYYYVDLMIILH